MTTLPTKVVELRLEVWRRGQERARRSLSLGRSRSLSLSMFPVAVLLASAALTHSIARFHVSHTSSGRLARARALPTLVLADEAAVAPTIADETVGNRVVTAVSYPAQFEDVFSKPLKTGSPLPKPSMEEQRKDPNAKKVPFSNFYGTLMRGPFSKDRKWVSTDWGRAIFFALMHGFGAFAPFFFTWKRLGLHFLLYVASGMGITYSYHRQLAHRSFKSPKWLEYCACYCGMMAMQGGPIEWVSDHRYHHLHTETPLDPHSSYEGFYWCASSAHPPLPDRLLLTAEGQARSAPHAPLAPVRSRPRPRAARGTRLREVARTGERRSHLGWMLDAEIYEARCSDRSNAADLAKQPVYRHFQDWCPLHLPPHVARNAANREHALTGTCCTYRCTLRSSTPSAVSPRSAGEHSPRPSSTTSHGARYCLQPRVTACNRAAFLYHVTWCA